MFYWANCVLHFVQQGFDSNFSKICGRKVKRFENLKVPVTVPLENKVRKINLLTPKAHHSETNSTHPYNVSTKYETIPYFPVLED